jgi:hypothetical protein
MMHGKVHRFSIKSGWLVGKRRGDTTDQQFSFWHFGRLSVSRIGRMKSEATVDQGGRRGGLRKARVRTRSSHETKIRKLVIAARRLKNCARELTFDLARRHNSSST